MLLLLFSFLLFLFLLFFFLSIILLLPKPKTSAGNAADTAADTGETLVANIGLTLRTNTGGHRTDTLADIARQ